MDLGKLCYFIKSYTVVPIYMELSLIVRFYSLHVDTRYDVISPFGLCWHLRLLECPMDVLWYSVSIRTKLLTNL